MLDSRHDFVEAEAHYLSALKIKPDHVLARLALAEVYANVGDMFKAHEALKHAERHHSLAKTRAAVDNPAAHRILEIRLAMTTSIILHKKALTQPYAELSSFTKQAAAGYDKLIDEFSNEQHGITFTKPEVAADPMGMFLAPALAVLWLNRGLLFDLQGHPASAKATWELVPKHILGYLPREYFNRRGALKSTSPQAESYNIMRKLPGPLFFMWEATVLDAEGRAAMHGPYKCDAF